MMVSDGAIHALQLLHILQLSVLGRSWGVPSFPRAQREVGERRELWPQGWRAQKGTELLRTESLRLEKTSEISKSNPNPPHHAQQPHPSVPHLHGSGTPPGTPPPPWAACFVPSPLSFQPKQALPGGHPPMRCVLV